MITCVTVEFGGANRLKWIKRNVATVSKAHGTSQDTLLEHVHVMQSYLQLLNRHFREITSLKEDIFKNSNVQAQPMKFKADFTRSRKSMNLCTIEELLEYLDEMQSLETNTNECNRPRSNMSREIDHSKMQIAAIRSALPPRP